MVRFRKFCMAMGTAALACSGLLFQASGAVAQSWPSRSVTIIVPFGAGSITDAMARVLADKLGPIWKQSVVVENRPGLPGTTAVAKSAPDGYTLMLTSNGHTIAGAVNKGIQFDPVVVDAFVRTHHVEGVSDPGRTVQPRPIPLLGQAAATRLADPPPAGTLPATATIPTPAQAPKQA